MPASRRRVEREPEPRRLRHHELAALERRRLREEPERPRHVLDGEAVRDRGDKVDVDLGDEVAHHRQVERLGHAGHLHPLRSEEHTSELQSQFHLVCRLLLEKKKKKNKPTNTRKNKKTKPVQKQQ